MILSRGSTSEGARKAKNRLIRVDFQVLIFKQILIDFLMWQILKLQARIVVRRGTVLLIYSAIEADSLNGALLRFSPFDVSHLLIMAIHGLDR
jgi:hypothetical protein